MFTQRFQAWVRELTKNFVLKIHLMRITPNALTLTGLAVTAVSAVLVGLGYLFWGGLVLIFASAFDMLDGAVARVTNNVRPYGAFLDSTTDRYAEGFTYLALLAYFLFRTHSTIEPLLVMLALAGSFLVSYVRARAQSLGFVCDGGILARPERVLITVLALMVPALLVPLLWVLAILTNFTAVQRIWLVWRQSEAKAIFPPAAVPETAAAGTTPEQSAVQKS